MQPSRAHLQAHFVFAAKSQSRKAKQYFDQAEQENGSTEGASESACDQFPSTMNLAFAAGDTWVRSRSVRKSMVPNSLSHAGTPQILAPTPI